MGLQGTPRYNVKVMGTRSCGFDKYCNYPQGHGTCMVLEIICWESRLRTRDHFVPTIDCSQEFTPHSLIHYSLLYHFYHICSFFHSVIYNFSDLLYTQSISNTLRKKFLESNKLSLTQQNISKFKENFWLNLLNISSAKKCWLKQPKKFSWFKEILLWAYSTSFFDLKKSCLNKKKFFCECSK